MSILSAFAATLLFAATIGVLIAFVCWWTREDRWTSYTRRQNAEDQARQQRADRDGDAFFRLTTQCDGYPLGDWPNMPSVRAPSADNPLPHGRSK